MSRFTPWALGCFLALVAPLLPAADLWRLCPLPELDPIPPADLVDSDDPQTYLGADRFTGLAEGGVHLQGNAALRQAGQNIYAAEMQYDQQSGIGSAEGEVRYISGDYRLHSDSLKFDNQSGYADFQNAEYRQLAAHLQGRAQRIERQGDSTTVLTEATLSSCPPEDEDWLLTSARIRLDHVSQQGTARHAVLRFQGVPFFYSPWFRFPLGEERQSGFLAPHFGQSGGMGMIFELPYYWNIAPQADATFGPRYMSERGAQLRSEVRYLAAYGEWQLDAEYLKDREYGDSRSFTHLHHLGQFGDWWSVIEASEASDPDYFDDLGNSLALTSITHLERRAEITHYGEDHRFLTRVQSYQTLDEDLSAASRPYQRLPQISYSWNPMFYDMGWSYRLDAEWVQFEREETLTGKRLNLSPQVSYPMGGLAWFATPRLTYRYSHYQLQDQPPSQDDELDRGVPLYSLDSGVFFERDAGDYLQTLEPRLFYLYVPYEAQAEIPRFDTGRYDFSFAQMFRENRFTGGDWVGDTEQITLALATRYLTNTTGVEVFSAAIGQVHYLEDRRLTTSGVPETEEVSNLILETAWRFAPRWSTALNLQHDPEIQKYERGVYQLQYRGGTTVANLAYRYRRELQEQVDLSFRYALTPRWNLLARWNRSLLEDEENQPQTLETLTGLEYEDCCWLLRVVGREYLIDEGQDTDQSIFVQLVLKGLGDVGRDAGGLLQGAILGYREEDYY